MTGILMLESLTRGNTLKQGDKTPLTYKLLDADGDNLNIAGKTATARLVHPNYLTIGYEKSGLTVSQDDTVTFTIDKLIPARKYNVEIIVDNKFVFPSRSAESKFTIDKSSLGNDARIIEIIGKEALIRTVKTQVDTELQPLITSMESAQQAELERVQAENERSEKYGSYAQQFSDVIKDLSEEKDYHSLPEISAARGGHDTLGQRLDETTAQLAQTTQKVDDIHINIKDYGAKSGDDITDILINLIAEEAIIFIPKGDYIFSRPIKTRKRVRIKGFDSKNTTLRYQPVIDDGSTALEVMSLNWNSEILTMENIYLRDESNETNTFISVGHSDDGQNFTWGARVRIENSAIRNYKNIGLHVVAPYNNLINNSTFRGKAVSESLQSTLSPVTNGVGIHFTGSGGNIKTFGNANRIVDTNFGDNIYGVELENIQSTHFDNCTFENNWIGAYLHSDDSSDKYKGTSRTLFTNCWFEDTKNGHPDLHIVDCKMDKATGQYDTTKEVSSSTTSINSNFTYKNMGLPASKGFNIDGTHWATDNPDQYLFRQWDRKWELGGGGKTDGVVTKVGGKYPYFRGVLGLNKGIEYHSASISSSTPKNKLTENVEIFDIRMGSARDNVFEYKIDLNKLTKPELFNANYSNYLRSKITAVVRSYDYNTILIEIDCFFYGMSGGGELRDSYKTVFTPNNQPNLKKVVASVEEDNNNIGLRIVRSGAILTLMFHISGFKGGTVYMENKYLTNMDPNTL